LAAVAYQLSHRQIDDLDALRKWLSVLVVPGASLGGARPRANFTEADGSLWIAKFPARDDDRDVGAWEYVTHQMATKAGIDVPEVLNLVFFKQVHSKTKFWQMIGRGTRLCENLYAPDKHKSFFNIFDFCQNFEFFKQNPNIGEGSKADSLDTRLFKMRLNLLNEIDSSNRPKAVGDAEQQEKDLRFETSDLLHGIVSNMTLDNIIVRPQRQYVEKYSVKDIWKKLTLSE
jgi:hypothetical protein